MNKYNKNLGELLDRSRKIDGTKVLDSRRTGEPQILKPAEAPQQENDLPVAFETEGALLEAGLKVIKRTLSSRPVLISIEAMHRVSDILEKVQALTKRKKNG